MAKTRPKERRSKKSKKSKDTTKKLDSTPPDVLLTQAVAFLHTGEPDQALSRAAQALQQLQPTPKPTLVSLPALSLLGEINIERGDPEAAFSYFSLAAEADPEGDAPEAQGGGAEKFFWLAQLCEEGGSESVQWYEKGAECLRRQITQLEDETRRLSDQEERETLIQEKREKLAQALCGIAEVYMTDLSWDDNEAEEQCNKVMVEALLVAPESPEVLQTIASVRISQAKRGEAKEYLSKSLNIWRDLPTEDDRVPDFPSRISLARLLMEAELEDDAIQVLERLVQEDDASVEAWYLGGWCLHLIAEQTTKEPKKEEEPTSLLRKSRAWLAECLRQYQLQDYEDEPLATHASELITELNKVLGPPADGETAAGLEADDDSGWEDADDDADEEMDGT